MYKVAFTVEEKSKNLKYISVTFEIRNKLLAGK